MFDNLESKNGKQQFERRYDLPGQLNEASQKSYVSRGTTAGSYAIVRSISKLLGVGTSHLQRRASSSIRSSGFRVGHNLQSFVSSCRSKQRQRPYSRARNRASYMSVPLMVSNRCCFPFREQTCDYGLLVVPAVAIPTLFYSLAIHTRSNTLSPTYNFKSASGGVVRKAIVLAFAFPFLASYASSLTLAGSAGSSSTVCHDYEYPLEDCAQD